MQIERFIAVQNSDRFWRLIEPGFNGTAMLNKQFNADTLSIFTNGPSKPNVEKEIPVCDLELAELLRSGKEPQSIIGKFLSNKLLATDDN